MRPLELSTAAVAAALTVAATLFGVLGPTGTSCSSTSTPGGAPSDEVCASTTLIEEDRRAAFIVTIAGVVGLIAPAIAGLRCRAPQDVRPPMYVCAALFSAFSIASALSVGFLFLPAVLGLAVMCFAAARQPWPPSP